MSIVSGSNDVVMFVLLVVVFWSVSVVSIFVVMM